MRLTPDAPGRRIGSAALIVLASVLAGGVGRGQQFVGRNSPMANAQAASHRQGASHVQPASHGQPPTPATATLRPIFHSKPGEHPLMPAVRWADAGLRQIESLHDYSCLFVKRERLNGELTPYTYLRLKVRHRPFSVYLHFDGPADERGQEAIYVEGRNGGKVVAHGVGLKAIAGTVHLDPTSPRAMAGSRHPITNIGILNMTRMFHDQGVKETQFGECEVRYLPGARLDGRLCTCMETTHPVPRREFPFHMIRVFVDEELNLPVRFETYDWPSRQGEAPVLSGEYTFLKLKLNNGFTDADFDERNPRYGYR
jgi:hypothetical protein